MCPPLRRVQLNGPQENRQEEKRKKRIAEAIASAESVGAQQPVKAGKGKSPGGKKQD